MKVYLPDLILKNINIQKIDNNLNNDNNVNNVNNVNIDLSIQKKTIEYNDIYSKEGLFRIQNNKIIQLIPEDVPISNFTYNDLLFLVDESKYIFRNVYHIPYNHIICNIRKTEYILNKSKVSLIVEYSTINKNSLYTINGTTKTKSIDNIYFFTNEDKLNRNLKEDIIEYLSLVNYIKQS
jgi:hypothetical protein